MVQKLLSGFVFALCLSLGYSASAQTPQFSFQGVTSGGNVFPLGSTINNKVQWVYTPSTHFPTAPAAYITKVYFKSANAITTTTITNLTIKLGPTALSQFTGMAQPWASGLTTVYSAPTTVFSSVAAAGWISVTLPTPYLFDPSQNLIVEMSATAYTSGITVTQETVTPGARQWGLVTNSITTNSNTGRVHFGFDTLAAPACNSAPTAGTTTAAFTQVCPGNNIQLGLSGNSSGLNQMYQLQSSPTLAGPYTSVGTPASSPFASVAATTSQYYRFRVTCGTGVDSSTPIQVTVAGLFPGGVYTINNALPTGGPNFNSFTAAVSAISCGISGPVVFNVANNATPYNEQFLMPQINNTSSVNTVTFNGNGATLSFTGAPALPADIFLNGADWIRIKRLNIVGTNAATGGMHMLNDANNVVVDSCTITLDSTSTNTTFGGIIISGLLSSVTTTGSNCDSITITNNTISGGYAGISLLGAAGLLSNGNLIARNTVKNFYVYGLYTAYLNATDIDENDIHRLTRTNVSTFYGVFMSTGSVGTRIRKNIIHDPATMAPTTSISSYGIYHSAADGTAAAPNDVSNNLIYNFKQTGAVYGLYNTASDYVRYYHNTVSLDDSTATATTGVARGFTQLTTSASNLELKNNIISVRRNTTGIKHAVYFGVAATTYSARNNDYYLTAPGASGGVAYYNATNYPTLAAYQSASLQDTGTVDADPMFVTPGGSSVASYTPTSVMVEDMGIPVPSVTTDILGTLRSPIAPDMGAIEFSTIPPCSAPTGLTAGSVTATSTTISWLPSTTTNIGYEYVISTSPTTPVTAGLPASASPASVSGLTAGTTYYVFVRTVCGINLYSPWAADTFATCIPPASTLVAMGSPTPGATAICQGDTAMLKAPGGTGYTYLFLLNGAVAGTGVSSDSVFRATQAGLYRVVVTNATGCFDTSAAVMLMVNLLPTPAIIQLTYNQLSTTTPFATYQWNLAGTPIGGATSQIYTAPVTGNGSYTVTVTDANGCRGTSNPYNLTTASVVGMNANTAIRVFPNPSAGHLFIESGVPVNAQLWTLDGRKLIEVTKTHRVDISTVSVGVYMLYLTDANGAVLHIERITKRN